MIAADLTIHLLREPAQPPERRLTGAPAVYRGMALVLPGTGTRKVSWWEAQGRAG